MSSKTDGVQTKIGTKRDYFKDAAEQSSDTKCRRMSRRYKVPQKGLIKLC